MPYDTNNPMMTTQGPVGMGNPMMNLMRRLMNRPQDIELPSESGEVDPRLLEHMANPAEQMRKAFRQANQLAAGEGPLGGLMRAQPK